MSNDNTYKIADYSYGYLMYLLYRRKVFSEIHLPSYNLIKRHGEYVIIKKTLPIAFIDRVRDIKRISNKSKLTNIKIEKETFTNDTVEITIKSKFGKCCNELKLTSLDKKKILNTFFEYHKEINTIGITLKTDYETFFNQKKFRNDISLIRKAINSRKISKFDAKVLAYMNLISKQRLFTDYYKLHKCNVHGDFGSRNIIKIGKKYSLIDLDMMHRGYLEIQLMRLLNELFSLPSKEFFENLKYCYTTFSLGKINSKILDAYISHKICDLGAIKSAYLTNEVKYKELQAHINSQIKYITGLIKQKDKISRVLDTL